MKSIGLLPRSTFTTSRNFRVRIPSCRYYPIFVEKRSLSSSCSDEKCFCHSSFGSTDRSHNMTYSSFCSDLDDGGSDMYFSRNNSSALCTISNSTGSYNMLFLPPTTGTLVVVRRNTVSSASRANSCVLHVYFVSEIPVETLGESQFLQLR